MPHFYFHLTTPTGWEADDIGVSYPSADHAMLEAWRTACEMSVDLLRDGQSPSRHRFHVHDEAGKLVFELAFSELFAVAAKRPGGRDAPVWARLHKTMATSQRLRSEMAATLVTVRSTMAQTTALLAREG